MTIPDSGNKNARKARSDKETYLKKKAGKVVEEEPTEAEVAAAEARELEEAIAAKRAAKHNVPLALVNRGEFLEGHRDSEQARAEAEQAARKQAKKEEKAKAKAKAKEARLHKKRARSSSDGGEAAAPEAPEAAKAAAPPAEPLQAEGGFFGFFRSLVSAH